LKRHPLFCTFISGIRWNVGKKRNSFLISEGCHFFSKQCIFCQIFTSCSYEIDLNLSNLADLRHSPRRRTPIFAKRLIYMCTRVPYWNEWNHLALVKPIPYSWQFYILYKIDRRFLRFLSTFQRLPLIKVEKSGCFLQNNSPGRNSKKMENLMQTQQFCWKSSKTTFFVIRLSKSCRFAWFSTKWLCMHQVFSFFGFLPGELFCKKTYFFLLLSMANAEMSTKNAKNVDRFCKVCKIVKKAKKYTKFHSLFEIRRSKSSEIWWILSHCKTDSPREEWTQECLYKFVSPGGKLSYFYHVTKLISEDRSNSLMRALLFNSFRIRAMLKSNLIWSNERRKYRFVSEERSQKKFVQVWTNLNSNVIR